MQPQFLLNGKIASEISVQDRGLHYGDGVFETIAVYQGTPLLWQAHMQRLQKGCRTLGFSLSDINELYEQAQDLCRTIEKAVLKIVITRGAGGRGYLPPSSPEPNNLLALYAWPEYPATIYQEGIALYACQMRYGRNPVLAKIKHLNRLEQILARSEFKESDYFEGVVFDTEGCVIEGTMSNLFVYKNNELLTPALDQCGIEGVIRNEIIQDAKDKGMEVVIKDLFEQDLIEADEVFLSNSVAGIVSVRSYKGVQYNALDIAKSLRDNLVQSNVLVPLP